MHRARGTDVAVSEFTAFRKKDEPGQEFSVTTLASGTTGTLLPEASQLSFVDQIIDPNTGLAQGTKAFLRVSWQDATDVAGHLLEPVPHLYPPRYRALGFPDRGIWEKLRERAILLG
jgi:hypothetical protein